MVVCKHTNIITDLFVIITCLAILENFIHRKLIKSLKKYKNTDHLTKLGTYTLEVTMPQSKILEKYYTTLKLTMYIIYYSEEVLMLNWSDSKSQIDSIV